MLLAIFEGLRPLHIDDMAYCRNCLNFVFQENKCPVLLICMWRRQKD